MISLARQTITYGLVLATVVYLSIAILGRSAQSVGEQVNYSSAIPEAPDKPYLFAEEQADAETVLGEPSEVAEVEVAENNVELPARPALEQVVDFDSSLPTITNKPPKTQIDQATNAFHASAAETSEPIPTPEQILAPEQASVKDNSTETAAEPTSAETASSPTVSVAMTSKPTHQSTAERGWSVRIGAFADQQSASTLIRALSDLGYAVFSQKAKDAGSRQAVTIVFVGPEQSQAEAEDLRVELQVMETIDGKVVYVK